MHALLGTLLLTGFLGGPGEPAEPAGAAAGAPAGAARVDEPPARRVRVFLRDGRTVEGELVERGAGVVRVRRDGAVETFADREVRVVLELDSLREDRGGPPDPGLLRHVHVPSAFGPGAGVMVIGVTPADLVATYGVARWLSATAALQGGLVPGGTFPSPALSLGADLRAAPERWLHVSAGLRVFGYLKGVTAYATGAVTLGSPSAHVTLQAGPPLAFGSRFGAFDEVGYGAAFTVRVLRNASVVGEAWISSGGSHDVAGAASARYIAGRIALDAGVIGSTRSVLPWIAIAWTSARREAP